MKGRQGVAGYNAQAMVSPTETDGGATGMLVTAVDVVDAAMTMPCWWKGRRDDRDKSTYDVGHAGRRKKHLAECKVSRWWCPSHGNGSCVEDSYHGPRRSSRATALRVRRDRRSTYTPNGVPLRRFRRRLSGMPSLQNLYQGQGDWAKLSHRAARRSAASPSRLDVHPSSQRSLRGEKATGRTGLRNHQGATGGT